MNKKKIILFIAVLLIILWLGWIIIYVKNAKKQSKTAQTPNKPIIEKSFLKTGSTENIFKFNTKDVSFPYVFSSREIIYFSSIENKFYSFNPENNLQDALNIDLENKKVLDVKYFPQVNKILIFTEKEGKTNDEETLSLLINKPLSEEIVYNTSTKEISFIKNPRYFQVYLLPDNKFIYYYFDEKSRENKIFQEDLRVGGLSRQELLDLGNSEKFLDVEFSGIFNGKLYYSKNENNIISLFIYDSTLKSNKKIISDFNIISFSLNGNKIFYTANNSSFIYDSKSGNIDKKIDFDGLAETILWTKDEKYIYYLKGEEVEADEKGNYYNLTKAIAKFDLQNNTKSEIKNLSKDGIIGIKEAFLSFDENILYFVNFADATLYKISLK